MSSLIHIGLLEVTLAISFWIILKLLIFIILLIVFFLIATDPRILSIIVFFADDIDLQLVEELGHLCTTVTLGLLLSLHIEATDVKLFTRIHLNHFVLPAKFSVSSIHYFVLGWPCLFGSKRARIIFDSIIISGVVTLGFSFLYTLDLGGLILDLFNIVGLHLLKGTLSRGSSRSLSRRIPTGDDRLSATGGQDFILLLLGELDGARVGSKLNTLNLPAQHRQAGQMYETLGIYKILTDVALDMHFILANMADLAKHIATILFPGDVLRESYCDLAEYGVRI